MFFSLVFLGLALAYFFYYLSTVDIETIILIYLALLINIHYSRNDISFLKRYSVSVYQELISEYQLLTLLVTIPLWFGHKWYYFFIIHALVFAIPLLPQKGQEKATMKILTRYIPSFHYEWISGIRKYGYLLPVLYLFILVLSPVKLFPMILFWLFGFFIQSFYTENESLYMLRAQYKTDSNFLYKKMGFVFKIQTILFFPVLLINSIFHFDMIGWNLWFSVFMSVSSVSSLVIKYKDYTPESSSRGTSLQMALINISIWQPYLIPVTGLVIMRAHQLAKQQINLYTDDSTK